MQTNSEVTLTNGLEIGRAVPPFTETPVSNEAVRRSINDARHNLGQSWLPCISKSALHGVLGEQLACEG